MEADEITTKAIAWLKTQGYRVTKPKEKTRAVRPERNCLGLRMSVLYDPNYKIKMPLSSIGRLAKNASALSEYLTK